MTSDELLTFVNLAETKNFSKTAELLFSSQSAVSSRIKTLENQLGQPLFIRDTKYVELTPAGQDFLNYALQVNRLLEESKQAVKISGKYRCQITLSAPESFWNSMIFPALDTYFDQNKDTSFNLLCDHSELVIQSILDNRVDLGISCLYVRHPDLENVPLQRNKFLLVCSPALSLAEEALTPHNVGAFPFISMDWGDFFQAWFSQSYLTSAHFLQAEKVFMFLHLLLSQKGVGFLPERIARPYLKSGELRHIPYAFSETAPEEVSHIVYKKKKQDLILPILHELLTYAKEFG